MLCCMIIANRFLLDASCDGCQLTLLDCEDELLALAGRVQIAHFLEASSAVWRARTTSRWWRARSPPPTDVERIRRVREQSRVLVTIGACATAGGIQALRNFADVDEFRLGGLRPARSTSRRWRPRRRSRPTCRSTSSCAAARSTARQLLEVLTALLAGRRPNLPRHSVCKECKLRGTTCVLVAGGTPVPGPGHPGRLRRAVPGLRPRLLRLLRARWPAPNPLALGRRCARPGMADNDIDRVYRTFNAATAAFADVGSEQHEHRNDRSLTVGVAGPGRGRGRDARRGRGRPGRATCGWRSTSRPGSSRRCCAGAATPSHPTSPPASAASARSPTR